MIKRRILELLLNYVRVPSRGETDASGESRHILRVSLVWPRMAIAHKTAVTAVELRDGLYRPAADSWTERIFFKEAVEGPFGLRIEVSEALSSGQWSEAVTRLGQAVWTMAGAQIVDFAEHPVTALLWRAPLEAMARKAGAAGREDPRPVASGTLDMRCDGWNALQEQLLRVPLVAPEDLSRVARRRVDGKLQSRSRVLLRRGEANGDVELTGRVYS